MEPSRSRARVLNVDDNAKTITAVQLPS